MVAATAVIACSELADSSRIAGPEAPDAPAFVVDVTPPTVAMFYPANGATNLPLDQTFVIQFNEAMMLSSINNSSFTVSPFRGSPLAGSLVFHGGNAVQFIPSSPLAAGTTYVLKVNSGAKDAAGNSLTPDFIATFRTGGVTDNTAPTVTSVAPVNAATNVAVNSSVVLTFSEAMNPSTITTGTVTLTPNGGSALTATVTYDALAGTATLVPSSPLAGGTTYTVNGKTGAKDMSTNALTAFSSTFTTVAGPDVTPPTVTTVSPNNASTNVAVGSTVVVSFSEAMDAATITGSTFTLTPSGGSPVATTVSYNPGNTTATLTPSAALSYSKSYTVDVTNGAKDVAGNGLTAFSSTFTTGPPPDVTPPTVTNVVPANNATGVATSSNVVVTFSEAMSAASITSSTFTLTPAGGAAIATTVSYNSGNNTATLTPSSALLNNKVYTVNVTSGAKDLANNGLTAFSSAFTTVASGDVTPPTVSMYFPQAGATNLPTSQTFVIIFSEPMNTSTITSSSYFVSPFGGAPLAGSLVFHGGNAVQFIPSSPLAAGTTYILTVNSGAKDVAGNGVNPNYTASFTTAGGSDNIAPTVTNVSPLNSASSVAVNSPVVVTFSEPMNAATITAATVTVTPSGGSPVAATVTYNQGNATATLAPSSPLATGTTYTVNATTGAKDVAGNALTAFSSTFTTVAGADVTPPTVTNVTPSNSATNVAVSSTVVVTFSEAMNAGTVTGSTFTLTPSGGSPIATTVSYNGGNNTATLTPSSALSYSTSYTVNVTSGAKDLANNALTAFSSTFATGAAPDITPPAVVAVNPTNASTNVSAATTIVLTFSEAMNAATITSSTFTVTPSGGSAVAGNIVMSGANTIATLTPSSALAPGTVYTVSATSGARDLAGNGLTAFSSTFTTAPAPDLTPPTVTNVVPANNATGIATSSTVVVTFSEAMSAASITSSTFTLTPSGGAAISANVSYNQGNNTATLTPSSALLNSKLYTVNVTSGAKDLANNSLTAFSSSFTTVAAGDVTPPTVSMYFPAAGATNIPANQTFVIIFSEPMNNSTITTASFFVSPSGGSPLAGSLAFHGGNAVQFIPSSPLAPGTTYVLTVNSGAKDLAGNGVNPNYTANFSTAPAADVTPPTVTAVTPLNSATNVAVNSTVVVTFSEAMNAGTVTGSTFTLTPSGGSPIATTVAYNGGNNTATLTPSSALQYSKTYTVNVTSGARDLANNGLTAFSSTFTTVAAPDLTPPTVITVNPTNASTNVAVGTTISVTFSEAMNAATIGGSTFTVTPSGGNAVAANIAMSGGNTIATLTPTSALAYSKTYTVNVTSAAKDLAGNGANSFSSTFTTVAAPDVTPPTVTTVVPADRSNAATTTAQVKITFSEPIDFSTVTASTFVVKEFLPGGVALAGTRTYDAGTNTIIFTPSAPYVDNKSYLVDLTTGIKDVAGNALAAAQETCFTPAAGNGTPISMTGFWGGNTSCYEAHWHLPIVEDSNGNLSLGTCQLNFCTSYSTSPIGTQRLGGDSCPPTNINPGVVYCSINVVSITGTHSGNNVSMTWTMDNGLTFNFVGVFAVDSNTGRKFLNGISFGATLPAIGTTFERENDN